MNQIEFNLQYLVKSHLAKFFLGAFHADVGDDANGDAIKNTAVQLGVQIVKM
jgi:hypothetical protein